MVFGNRWYDINPKVSHAVGCIEEANDKLKKKLTKVIIKTAMEMGIRAKRPNVGFFRRWYDEDKELSLAMEYFKLADDNQRIEIAEHIISYITVTREL